MSAIEEMAKVLWKAEGGSEDGWFHLLDRSPYFERAYAMLDALIAHLKAGAPEMVEAFDAVYFTPSAWGPAPVAAISCGRS